MGFRYIPYNTKQNNMKEFIQKYQKTIVGVGALSVLVLSYFQNQEIHRLRSLPNQQIQTLTLERDSLMNVLDSVRAENLPLQVENARYWMSLELLREEDKKAAELFQLILETQTE
jgi:hypothetical protein